jgi:hypothetical protein
MNRNGGEIGGGSLLSLHALRAVPMLAAALQFHILTLESVRAFHPDYPRLVTLAPYTPVGIAPIPHGRSGSPERRNWRC